MGGRVLAESLHLVMDQWIQYKLGKQYLLKKITLPWELNPGPTPIRGGPVTIIASVGLKYIFGYFEDFFYIFSQFIWPGASKNYTLQCIVTSSHQVQAGFNIPNCCQVRGLLGLHDHDWQKILVLPKIIPPLPSTSSQFIWPCANFKLFRFFSKGNGICWQANQDSLTI